MIELDIENWARKEHFHFFNTFEEPYFGVTVDIECTKAQAYCVEHKHSFFVYYLHKALQAINAVEPFKYRIIEDKVMICDTVNGGSTIMRPNGTFGFSNIEYFEDFLEFEKSTLEEIERVKQSTNLLPSELGENIVHFSVLPWLKFTSLSHARKYSFKDSVPKITFGKITEHNGIKYMPMSVHVHHALMDGLHVGQLVEIFQRLMDEQ